MLLLSQLPQLSLLPAQCAKQLGLGCGHPMMRRLLGSRAAFESLKAPEVLEPRLFGLEMRQKGHQKHDESSGREPFSPAGQQVPGQIAQRVHVLPYAMIQPGPAGLKDDSRSSGQTTSTLYRCFQAVLHGLNHGFTMVLPFVSPCESSRAPRCAFLTRRSKLQV